VRELFFGFWPLNNSSFEIFFKDFGLELLVPGLEWVWVIPFLFLLVQAFW